MEELDPLPAAIPQIAPTTDDATARRRWISLGLVMLLSFLPSVVAAMHEMIYPNGPLQGWSNYRLVGGLIRQVSCLLLLLYVLSIQRSTLTKIGLGFRWTDPLIAAGLTFLTVIAEAVMTVIAQQSSLHWLGRVADIRHPDMDTGILSGLVLAYSISSPIFEEVLVRGYLMTEMVGLGKPLWLATLASIVLQTSYHVYYGFAGAVSISGIFIVLALYFAWTRRLLPVILAHLYWDVGIFLIKHH